MYSKIKQWDALVQDFSNLENDEELLILLGGRSYIIRLASNKDFENHNRMEMVEDVDRVNEHDMP